MRDHGMNDFWRLPKTTGHLSTDNGMWPLDLLIDGFAHVVQERSRLTYIYIGTQLVSNSSRQYRDFDGMGQHVLPIAGAKVQAAKNFEQFWLQPMHIRLHRSAFTGFTDNHLHFLAGFGNDLFDTRRV